MIDESDSVKDERDELVSNDGRRDKEQLGRRESQDREERKYSR
jgi:hypothetical protein